MYHTDINEVGTVHLRDGTMMETVVPTIRKGGVNTVYVVSRPLLYDHQLLP